MLNTNTPARRTSVTHTRFPVTRPLGHIVHAQYGISDLLKYLPQTKYIWLNSRMCSPPRGRLSVFPRPQSRQLRIERDSANAFQCLSITLHQLSHLRLSVSRSVPRSNARLVSPLVHSAEAVRNYVRFFFQISCPAELHRCAATMVSWYIFTQH